MPHDCPHPECDATFETEMGPHAHYSSAHNESPTDAQVVLQFDMLPEDFYREQYVEKGNTQETIAAMLSVTTPTVSRRLQAHGITTEEAERPNRGIVAQKRDEMDREADADADADAGHDADAAQAAFDAD